MNTLSAARDRKGLVRLRTTALGLFAAASPLLLALSATPLDAGMAQAANQVRKVTSASQEVRLGLNKSIVIDLPADAYDILVANPGVSDAVSRTARRIYVFGKSVGSTNIFVFGAKGEQIASFDLTVERDVSGLDVYLARFVEDSDIKTEIVNDNIVLTGTVQTPQDASRAVALAQAFIKGGEATTGQFSSDSSSAPSNTGTSLVFPTNETRQQSQIVNLLKIVGEDQVTLKVTVAEIQRNVMKQLGVNTILNGSTFLQNSQTDGISFGALTDNISGLGKAMSVAGASAGATIGNLTLNSYLNAMEQTGVMKTLAEPSLTAISGEKATFKVGGEYNIVTGQDIDDKGKITFTSERMEYGIGLEFLPTVLSPGRISLKVRTSVSEPTTEGTVSLSRGGQAPGTTLMSIRKRLADTTVELPSGGSMMIAGLVRDDLRQAVSGMPGLTKIPVLGTLFRSRDFVRNESELVIIVTPYLVRPVARNKLALPTDNFQAASDGAANFLGKINRVYGTTQTNLKPGRYNGVVGFIYK